MYAHNLLGRPARGHGSCKTPPARHCAHARAGVVCLAEFMGTSQRNRKMVRVLLVVALVWCLDLAGMPAAEAGEAAGGQPLVGEEGLSFSDAWQRFAPGQEQSTVTGVFHFINRSTRRVALATHPYCDCIRTSADKEAYEPGEAGIITAIMTIGSTAGIVVKKIAFTTDHPNQAKGELAMELTLPPVPRIDTSLVSWWVGDAPTPIIMRIIVPEAFHHHITGVQVSDPGFTASLVEDAALPGFHLAVAPVATARAAHATIILRTDCARTFEVEAVVHERAPDRPAP